MNNDPCSIALAGIRPVLVARAEKLCGNRDDAEDIAQDATLRLVQAWERIELSRLAQYAGKVVVHVFLDRLRTQKRRVQSIPWSQIDAADVGPDDIGVDPRTSLEERELIRLAMSYLTPVLREVMSLFYFGMSYDEIADTCGIPVGTVRSRLNRARIVMRDAMCRHGAGVVMGIVGGLEIPEEGEALSA